jgi:Family of unknown function (DUF6498)
VNQVSLIERVMHLRQSERLDVALLATSNLVPLLGVLLFDWNVFAILILYWVENGVVGAINALKIRKVEAPQVRLRDTAAWRRFMARDPDARQGSVLPLFIANYGIFWLVHGFFVFLLPLWLVPDGSALALPVTSLLGMLVAIAGLTISDAARFRSGFLAQRRYLETTAQHQLLSPYPRLFTLHFVIIFGAAAALFLGQPTALIVLLVLIKTGFELGALVIDRRRAPVIPAATPAVALTGARHVGHSPAVSRRSPHALGETRHQAARGERHQAQGEDRSA